MVNDAFTFLVGGKAGEGAKKTGSVAAQFFTSKGLHVFQYVDYMSLIRGGHNFSVVSTSNRWISNHYMKANLIVNLDKRSYDTHKNHLAENGIMVYNSDVEGDMEGVGVPLTSVAKNYPKPRLMLGVGGVSILAAAIGFTKEKMNVIIGREYPSGKEENISYATKIYDIVYPEIGNKFQLKEGDKLRPIISGNQAISLGAIAAGLDVYFGYPMTPASSILHFMAAQSDNYGLTVIHPENEIAVINMAIGSTFAGAKTMVGSSGGGFALMEEGFSLAGMAEAPILCALSMRSGPATGVPTYTEQGDLNFALNAGHGEFLRIVASPSTIEEAYYLTAEMLELVWRFQTPGIILTEKHLSESEMTVDINLDKTSWAEPKMHSGGEFKRYFNTEDGISPLLFPPSKEVIKWTSYEHDELGITTENADAINLMHNKRAKKNKAIIEYLKTKNTINIFGEKGPLIFTYGSTTMSVLEALKCGDIEARVIQPRFLSPFPVWELDGYKKESVISIELSKAGQFSNLLKDKTGIVSETLLNRYDGRPFDPIELSDQIKEVL